MYCTTQHMHSLFTEKTEGNSSWPLEMKEKKKKRDRIRRDYETKSKHTRTECILCSDDWRDIVITYVPQLSNTAIEDNYADISQEEIKKAYKQNQRRAQKTVKYLHMLSSFYNFVQKFYWEIPEIYIHKVSKGITLNHLKLSMFILYTMIICRYA